VVWLLAGLFVALVVWVNEAVVWVRWLVGKRARVLVDSIEMVHTPGVSRAVLLLHEFSGLPVSLHDLGRRLYEEGWDVFIPAMPETVSGDQDLHQVRVGPLYFLWYERAQQELCRLREQYACVAVGGASIGGSIALDLASRYDVQAVFAVSAPAGLFGWHYFRPWSRNAMLLLSGWIGLVFPWWRTAGSVRTGSREKRYGVDGVIWARAIHSQKIGLRHLRRRLGYVRAPCLLIQANNDRTVHPASILRLMRGLRSTSCEAWVLDMRQDTETRHHLLLNHEDVRHEVRERIVAFLGRVGHV